jgi:hypothetical protein
LASEVAADKCSYRKTRSAPCLDERRRLERDGEIRSFVVRVATLYEPVLIDLGHGILQFRGIERVNDASGKVAYVQEWRCEVLQA